MSRVKSFLKHSLLTEAHLWVAFAAAAVLFLCELLHMLHIIAVDVSEKGILYAMMICVLAFVGDRLKEAYATRDNARHLKRIADVAFDGRVFLRRRPEGFDDYDRLWGDFTGTYRAYNPSYRLERLSGEDHAVTIFSSRFRDPRFEKARYLFLVKDQAGRDDLARFREFLGRIKHDVPNIESKVQIKTLDKDAMSDVEMYVGLRAGKAVGILEIPPSPTWGGSWRAKLLLDHS